MKPEITATACSADAFRALAALMSANAAGRLPGRSALMPGDLAWRLPGSAPEENIRLFHLNGELAAWAWFDPPTGFEFDLHHSLPADHFLVGDILSWAESRRAALPPARPRFLTLSSMSEWAEEIEHPQELPSTERCLTTPAGESDHARTRRLSASGYMPTAHFAALYRWDLRQPVPDAPAVPTGRIRHVAPGDLQARIDVHRAAWLKSSFSAAAYEAIRSLPVYDPTLDLVLDTGEGFAAYCLCWADRPSGVGIFEPVGTHPAWRGRGAGRAVIVEGLRRLKALGMHTARVETAGFNEPAQALYESCGFEREDTARTWMKVVRP